LVLKIDKSLVLALALKPESLLTSLITNRLNNPSGGSFESNVVKVTLAPHYILIMCLLQQRVNDKLGML